MMAYKFTKLKVGSAANTVGLYSFSTLSVNNGASAGNYIVFNSPNSFTLKSNNDKPSWDGVLEYSIDLSVWNVWDGTLLTAEQGTLYLRGTGNTKITGDASGHRWVLSGSEISCNGNIENLLDYATVSVGEHPQMARYCFNYLFSGCDTLTTAPELPATTLSEYCYSVMFQNCRALSTAPELPATTLANGCYSNMFKGCTGLTAAPELPATTLSEYCYNEMFRECAGLTAAPKLPATTLAKRCYSFMFGNCTRLVSIPALPATTLAKNCYETMFYGCRALIINDSQSSDAPHAYRIPTSGTGIDGGDSLNRMFINTGGTFTSGTPSINMTYYTQNEPI